MISVIVPVFNVEAYLEECLGSIVSQTYADLQIILVDDGSTDGSGAICDIWAARDPRIQVIHQKNRGLSAARNRGIELAKGAYITFVDSDDYLLPDCLETLLQLCLDHRADISVCAHKDLAFSEKHVFCTADEPIPEPETFSGAQKMSVYLQTSRIHCVAWAKLYSAELFQTIRYPEGKAFEDVSIFHQLLHAAGRVAVTRKTGYVYRKRRGSITEDPLTHQCSDRLDAYSTLVAFTEKEYPSLLPYAHILLVNACITQLLRIYEHRIRQPELTRRLQAVCRKHFFTYFRHGSSWVRKIFIALVCLDPVLISLPARLYSAFRTK